MTFRPLLCLLALLAAVAPLRAEPAPSTGNWDVVTVEPMKTSIYIGSVTLTAPAFHREGNRYSSTYEARVRPWIFWSETGRITITLAAGDLDKLARGERVEFTGQGTNHKNKPRTVTGRAEPTSATGGKIKVRIGADGYELVFNGTYRLN